MMENPENFPKKKKSHIQITFHYHSYHHHEEMKKQKKKSFKCDFFKSLRLNPYEIEMEKIEMKKNVRSELMCERSKHRCGKTEQMNEMCV
jgi:hypothetical protein